ncbi:Flp family type IVb pilin [Comamonas testosteroni]
MTNFIKNFWMDEEGATAIEYGLIAGLIAVAIIAGATSLGTGLNNTFCAIGKVVTGAATATTGNDAQSAFQAAMAACTGG